MTGQIDITASLDGIRSGAIRFEIAGRMPGAFTDFTLEALAVGNGIAVTDLAVYGPAGHAVPFELYESTLRVKAPVFTISYGVRTRYAACVGVDKEHEIIYPFANTQEALFGSGAVAYPADLRLIEGDLSATFQVIDLPRGFSVFSNILAPDDVIPAALKSFFVYCSRRQPLHERVVTFADGHTLTLRLLVQHGKLLPVPPGDLLAFMADYLRHLETRIAPYGRVDTVHVLVLQADENFEHHAENRTFATGENVINGIVCYAPAVGGYVARTLGAPNYAWYLHDGLAHELTHLYTTMSDDGRHKAILYPAEDCPGLDRQAIGEALAGYLHRQYMHSVYDGAADRFLTATVARWFERQQARGRRSAHLDLFLFESWLRLTHGLTLWDALRNMVQRQPGPFHSAAALFDALDCDVPAEQRAWISGHDIPDYAAELPRALAPFGYTLDGTAINRTGEPVIRITW